MLGCLLSLVMPRKLMRDIPYVRCMLLYMNDVDAKTYRLAVILSTDDTCKMQIKLNLQVANKIDFI